MLLFMLGVIFRFQPFVFCWVHLILIHVFLCVNNVWIKETHNIPMVWVWDLKCDWFEFEGVYTVLAEV